MRAVHGAVVQVQRVRAAQFGQQGGVQVWPDACLGPVPVPQPTPGRDSGAAHGLGRNVAPGNAGPQDVHDAGESRSVRNAKPPWMPAAAFGGGWQQRGHPLAQVVRNKISTHPDTPPTKIGKCRTRSSTHSETVS